MIILSLWINSAKLFSVNNAWHTHKISLQLWQKKKYFLKTESAQKIISVILVTKTIKIFAGSARNQRLLKFIVPIVHHENITVASASQRKTHRIATVEKN